MHACRRWQPPSGVRSLSSREGPVFFSSGSDPGIVMCEREVRRVCECPSSRPGWTTDKQHPKLRNPVPRVVQLSQTRGSSNDLRVLLAWPRCRNSQRGNPVASPTEAIDASTCNDSHLDLRKCIVCSATGRRDGD
jgi:hypothetical protein